MNINLIWKIAYAGFATLLLAGSLFAAPPAQAPGTEGWQFQNEASGLFEEVQLLSGKLERHAETLESGTIPRISWQSHADSLDLIKQCVNQIGERLERLQEIRQETAPWQQQALDQILPVGLKLASHTKDAIAYLRENRLRLFSPVYVDHLSAIADHAEEMKTSADTYLEYAHTQQELQRLRDTIQIGQS